MKSVLSILSILIFALIAVAASDLFSGKWKGEIAAGPCCGFGAPGGGGGGGGGGGFPGGGAPGGGGGGGRGGPGFNFLSEAGQRGGGFPGGGGPGGGAPGDSGGGFPGGAGARGTQKVTLNIQAKDDKKAAQSKLSGNITIGETTEDIREGRIDGMKISFATGKPPGPVCQYAGELNSETNELRVTRTTMGSTAPGIPLTLKR